ncbi:MAG: ABC transporter permease [Bacteroidia bacterium]
MSIISFFTEGISIALKAIFSNRLRSFLTMLGVAIGIFLTTTVLSLVSSLETSLTSNLSALGNTTVFVHNLPWADPNANYRYLMKTRPQVSYRDYARLEKDLDNVTGVVFDVSVGGQSVKYKGISASYVAIVGTTADMPFVKEVDLREGRHFTSLEFQKGRYVCLLGYDIWKTLFDDKLAVGKQVRIAGKRFTVAGVMAKRGVSFGGPGEDGSVYIPYKAADKIYNIDSRRLGKVITIKANSYEELPYVENEIKGLIRAERGLKPQVEDNFSINKQEMLMKAFGGFFGVMNASGLVMTVFSLIIGLFSIALIMYISVKERTKEIGIQKALGAKNSFILFQFLTESILICIAGGLFGLLLVIGFTTWIQNLIDSNELPFSVIIGQFELLLCVYLSIGTGVLAGIIPASIASRMDPVIAIRKG